MLPNSAPARAAKPVVLGYYTDWAAAAILPPDRIDFRLFTHLAHSFASIGPDGQLRLPERRTTAELSRRARAAKVKLLLVLEAQAVTVLSKATAKPSDVSSLAEALVRAVREGGYDGIDIDWEGIENQAEQEQMNALVRAVRAKLPENALLTMAVPSTDRGGKWFSTETLVPLVDYLNVMTYDFHGPWSDHAGHNAAINACALGEDKESCRGVSVIGALDYWLKTKRWPANKLVLGLPLYGRGFRAGRWGEATSGSYERSEVPYRDVLSLIQQGWEVRQDRTASVAYLVSPEGKELVSFEDATAARRKGALAREQGMAGVFFWEVSQDRVSTENGIDPRDFSLVRAAREGLKVR